MNRSSWMWVAGLAVAALESTDPGPNAIAHAANVLPQNNLADVCPIVDERDTVDSVRAGLARRLGKPLKEETLGTQYVLTYKQRDGSQLFVTLTRDNDKLEVSCDSSAAQ